ncbi:MAG: Uma2 family endonuclease [Candidatus Promineofilum sp.]|nr:Uma2 family endonuclease [Promineifilum sp.]
MIAEPVEQIETIELTRRRFTAAEYWRLLEAGILSEDDAVELIWGELIETSPINVPHALYVNRLNMVLVTKLANRATVSVQNPIQLDEYSLPQPDIALWKSLPEEYRDRLAGPSELLLVVEVADSSIPHDQKGKTKLYGAAGIADYWIVNLKARRIEVYREPRPDGYRTVTHYAPGETLSPLAFADVVVNVDEILGTKA